MTRREDLSFLNSIRMVKYLPANGCVRHPTSFLAQLEVRRGSQVNRAEYQGGGIVEVVME